MHATALAPCIRQRPFGIGDRLRKGAGDIAALAREIGALDLVQKAHIAGYTEDDARIARSWRQHQQEDVEDRARQMSR